MSSNNDEEDAQATEEIIGLVARMGSDDPQVRDQALEEGKLLDKIQQGIERKKKK